MAAALCARCCLLHILCFFPARVAASSPENTTDSQTNTTGVTYADSSTTEPAGFETPTTEGPRPSTAPPPAESVFVSPRSLSPLTEVSVGSFCPCDQHTGVCDINCCCDRECVEEVSLFTGCSLLTVSGNTQLCSRDVASYTLGSTADGYAQLHTSVLKETSYDAFCIHSLNRVDILSHPSPALPTDTNFESLFKHVTSFTFNTNAAQDTAGPQGSAGYKFGDVMETSAADGQRRVLVLPAPGVSAECVDISPAAFLKDQSSWCSRRVVLDQDCSALPALNRNTYSSIQVFAGRNEHAAVVPVEVTSLTLQALDGTQTELDVSGGGGGGLSPALVSERLCANVVLKVDYVMTYSPAGEIVSASVSVLLGFVPAATRSLKQEFQITFVQVAVEGAVQYSGNPGYVVGLPLVSGTRTADGIVRSVDPRDTLSLLQSAEGQDCLRGPRQRPPVRFGLDSVSGCTLRIEDAANCSVVSQLLLDVLRGPNSPTHVASFGNSPLGNPLDWVQIQSSFVPEVGQSCKIPLSLHLEIKWTQYGSLVNPQPQIVSISETVQTNRSSLSLLSGGSSFLSVTSSVAFVPVSAAALPGYRATPTIDAKLPFDFFFPFV